MRISLLLGLLLLTSSVAIAQDGMDLPVSPVKLGDRANSTPTPEPVPEDDDGEDPRDTPPPIFYGEEIDSENDTIYYVIDISCSMGWDFQFYSNDDGEILLGARLARAKAELIKSVSGLSSNFKFNIIAYDCGVRSWQTSLQEATDPNKQSAKAWTLALNPTGATGTGPATATALADKENTAVVLLTDGAPNCGASDAAGHRGIIQNANTQGAVIDVFGISASGAYRAFCQGVASDSGGSYHDIP